jgi:hypothetical protein
MCGVSMVKAIVLWSDSLVMVLLIYWHLPVLTLVKDVYDLGTPVRWAFAYSITHFIKNNILYLHILEQFSLKVVA